MFNVNLTLYRLLLLKIFLFRNETITKNNIFIKITLYINIIKVINSTIDCYLNIFN